LPHWLGLCRNLLHHFLSLEPVYGRLVARKTRHRLLQECRCTSSPHLFESSQRHLRVVACRIEKILVKTAVVHFRLDPVSCEKSAFGVGEAVLTSRLSLLADAPMKCAQNCECVCGVLVTQNLIGSLTQRGILLLKIAVKLLGSLCLLPAWNSKYHDECNRYDGENDDVLHGARMTANYTRTKENINTIYMTRFGADCHDAFQKVERPSVTNCKSASTAAF